MLKAIAFILFAAATIIAGLWAITRAPIEAINQKEPMPMEINFDQRLQKDNAGVPATLEIPSLYLYSPIEEVQIDRNGYLLPPAEITNAAWYGDSKKIGDKGITLIAGNFDLDTGRAGPFYHVGALQKGDLINLLDLNGKKTTYTVIDKGPYDWNTNLKSFSEKTDKSRLYLLMYPAHAQQNANNPVSKTIIYAEKQ